MNFSIAHKPQYVEKNSERIYSHVAQLLFLLVVNAVFYRWCGKITKPDDLI
jgi:hypothetical protein